MSFGSKAYIAAIMCAGCASLVYAFATFHTDDPYRFAWYLILALFASGMKVRLPAGTGTLSVLFLFILVAVIQLNMQETLVIGFAATFVQSFWRATKPKLIHLGFNITSLAVATTSTYLVYDALARLRVDPSNLFLLITAVIVFFGVNTMVVSVVIALTESKSLYTTWKAGSLWSFPYYVAGGCVAGLLSLLTRVAGWQASFLVLPIFYFTYRSYRLYLDRLNESRLHTAELRAAAEQLNAVLESTTDCVLAMDAHGHIMYANHRARTRLFDDTESVGTLLWDRFPSLANAGFKDRLGRALGSSNASETEEYFPELNAWFELHAYPSRNGTALYLKEVTKQRELVEQLQQARKMEAVGRLAGGVAHDFNNLLTIILGYGQIVAELLEPDNPARKTIMEVLHAGERAAALTGRLLAFSRKQIQNPEILDINGIISGIEGMVRRLIGEDIRITVNLDPAVRKIRADQSQIEQVIMNLAANARDAMPTGGELKIVTRAMIVEPGVNEPPEHYVVLSVSDTGCGMDASVKARIFEPFFTTRERGKGTGLGLSVVYGIVQQSRGRIMVDSEVGRGTILQICLPCVAEPAAVANDSDYGVYHQGAGKVLLVEDERAVKSLITRILTEAGYIVVSPEDGGEALALSKAELDSIDLVITDVVMPDINGLELAAHLLKRNSDLRVLYMSGHTDHALVSDGLFGDGTHLLHKPFTRAQILNKVRKVLEAPPQAAVGRSIVAAAG